VPVLQRSVNKQTIVRVYHNGWEKITLDEEGICEILVADTNSESGSEASDFKNDFEEEEEEEDQQQQQQTSAEFKT